MHSGSVNYVCHVLDVLLAFKTKLEMSTMSDVKHVLLILKAK